MTRERRFHTWGCSKKRRISPASASCVAAYCAARPPPSTTRVSLSPCSDAIIPSPTPKSATVPSCNRLHGFFSSGAARLWRTPVHFLCIFPAEHNGAGNPACRALILILLPPFFFSLCYISGESRLPSEDGWSLFDRGNRCV